VTPDPFAEIDFTLPARGRAKAAREIGRRCALAWTAAMPNMAPPETVEQVRPWPGACREQWREGFAEAYRARDEDGATERAAVPAGSGALIGYARVSTHDQSTALQHDALTRAGCIRIFAESASGAQRERPELAKALDYMRPGLTLVVWKLDRLARSLKQLIETVEALEARKIGFRSLTEAIDTTTPGGKLIFHIFAALAEFERSIIRERTKAGLDAARARGRTGGRPPALSPQDIQQVRALLRDPDITVAQVAQRFGVGESTLYRHLPGGRHGAAEPSAAEHP